MTLPTLPDDGGGPITHAWRAAHRLRRRWYRTRARRLPAPTVSVGNLHWGGTGKTPLVAAIARRLLEEGHLPAVLSRGYGRVSHGPLVVGRGSGPEVGPAEAGDEPFLLARELADAYVVVAETRFAAGEAALRLEPTPDLFLLDDGFSHLRLARDVDLLAIPRADPWGGDRLPPRGRLREPLASAGRADALLVTGDEVTPETATEVASGLARRGFRGPAFAAPTLALRPRRTDGTPFEAGGPVLLVTGVARPERVRRAAEAVGLDVAEHLAFADHHEYPEPSLERIRRRADRLGVSAILTTTKDEAKLADRLTTPLAVLPVEARIDPPFWPWLASRLAAVREDAS